MTVTGQGFTALGRGGNIYLNLVTPDGGTVDMQIADISCVVTPNSIFYLYVVGCSSGASGPRIVSGDDGSFTVAVTVPSKAAPGAQLICARSVFINSVCTPFTVEAP